MCIYVCIISNRYTVYIYDISSGAVVTSGLHSSYKPQGMKRLNHGTMARMPSHKVESARMPTLELHYLRVEKPPSYHPCNRKQGRALQQQIQNDEPNQSDISSQ